MRRIDAEKLFEKLGNIKPKNKQQYEDIGMFMEMVTNSPTVEERPRGEWQKWSIDPRFNLPTYKCALCGLIVANIDSSMNYCGNCGALMVKEGVEE